MNTDRIVHDWLLANKPETASHEADSCSFCTDRPSEQEEDVTADTKVFTEEQHDALLTSAVQKAVAEATASSDGEVLRLNERLQAAEKELADRDGKIAELEAIITTRDEQDRLAALASERAKLVQASAHFTADQIEARKAQWAKMSEEDFKVYLEDIREIAKNVPPQDGKKVPETSFDGTRETAGDQGNGVEALRAFFSSKALTVAEI